MSSRFMDNEDGGSMDEEHDCAQVEEDLAATRAERDAWKEQAIRCGMESPGIRDRETVTIILEGRVARLLRGE